MVPQLPQDGSLGPHLDGLHLVIILQRKLRREGELWLSAVAKQLRKGLLEFDTFTPKLFCSGSPQVTVGAWMFPVRETAGIRSVRLSICSPSTSPPTHSSSVCEHVLGLSPHRDQTDLSSRMSGWEGQLYYNRCHYVTQIPGTSPSALSTRQFSRRGDFVPHGDIWQYLDTFLVVTAGGYSWLLVGRSRECCHNKDQAAECQG